VPRRAIRELLERVIELLPQPRDVGHADLGLVLAEDAAHRRTERRTFICLVLLVARSVNLSWDA
jgi:hypothetical protein